MYNCKFVNFSYQKCFCLQIVCYYTNWSQYRTKLGKFLPEDIQPDLCTHIIFAFGWLKKGKLSSFESNDETKDGKTGLYDRINNLKKANPKLKVLLAIGMYQYAIYNLYLFKIVIVHQYLYSILMRSQN